jgi:hypothetical protein
MASDNTPSMLNTPTDESDIARGFFTVLPREIRDQIYDLISQDEEELIQGHRLSVFLLKIRTTVPKVRLICHQAKTEYDARPLVDNHLQLSECYAAVDRDLRQSLSKLIPLSASQTKTLHFDLVCCNEAPDRSLRCLEPSKFATTGKILRRRYAGFIKNVTADLPLLEKVSINLSCGNMRCAMALQMTDEPWTNIPKLSHVTLPRCTYDHTLSRNHDERSIEYELGDVDASKSAEFFEERDTMATWTPATGWEADAEVVEDCLEEEAEWLSSRLEKGRISSRSNLRTTHTDTLQF